MRKAQDKTPDMPGFAHTQHGRAQGAFLECFLKPMILRDILYLEGERFSKLRHNEGGTFIWRWYVFFPKLPLSEGGTFMWVGTFLKNFLEEGVVRLFGMVHLFGTE